MADKCGSVVNRFSFKMLKMVEKSMVKTMAKTMGKMSMEIDLMIASAYGCIHTWSIPVKYRASNYM